MDITRKTLDPVTNTVHLIHEKKRNNRGMLKCKCGCDSGMFWTNVDPNEPVNCLICYGIIQKQANRTK